MMEKLTPTVEAVAAAIRQEIEHLIADYSGDEQRIEND